MKVLVIGGGGREHALAWKLAQSPKVQAVYVAPGNGGTALDPRLENVDITDIPQLRKWALDQKIALTVVGPEGPLAAGVVDDFRAHGLRVFGPTKAAAQLESSKAFSKAFMKRHGIPTAEYQSVLAKEEQTPVEVRYPMRCRYEPLLRQILQRVNSRAAFSACKMSMKQRARVVRYLDRILQREVCSLCHSTDPGRSARTRLGWEPAESV